MTTRPGGTGDLAVYASLTGRALIAVRRGRVQHLGSARRPQCRQAGRRWQPTPAADPRPLCSRCKTWALHRCPDLPYLTASPAQITTAVRAVTDPRELHRLVLAICSRADLIHHVVIDPDHGTRRRLTALVPEARRRCATPTSRRNR